MNNDEKENNLRCSLVILIGDFAHLLQLLHDTFCAGVNSSFGDAQIEVETIFLGSFTIDVVVLGAVGALLAAIAHLLANTLHGEVSCLFACGGLARAEQLCNVGS